MAKISDKKETAERLEFISDSSQIVHGKSFTKKYTRRRNPVKHGGSLTSISNKPHLQKLKVAIHEEVSAKSSPPSGAASSSTPRRRENAIEVKLDTDIVGKEERESFAKQVRLFISRMQLVQGERKFCQWKGSVMDSIGGVFLTQNAHDTASSSAFMSLAARYPYQAAAQNVQSKMASCSASSEVRNDDTLLPINGTSKGKEQETQEMIQGVNKGKAKQMTETNSKRKRTKKKAAAINWENLRKRYSNGGGRKETYQTSQSIDWEAVRIADVHHISKAIKKRGMNNNLAARIKNCVKVLSQELGDIDLEWLRDVPPNKAKEYLMSIPGLGLKSAECIRLLTLRQKAFPIDTNAGRIAIRLGWVPLQPLPEGQEFHTMKTYPKVNPVQKYIWPRLSELDPSELYELHCTMITSAKVFCTKKQPNCKACPMRDECKHYASTLASSRQIALHSERKKYQSHERIKYASNKNQRKMKLSKSHTLELGRPIEKDIEDIGRDGVPRILNDLEKLKKSMNKFIIEKNRKEGEMLPLVVPTLETTPTPILVHSLRNKSLSRTEHQVFVLPDSHRILAGLPEREENELCPYLFAVWTPESLNKHEYTPEQQTVNGTILIPSRTAVSGAFPLNGTYFQANEVFADDESSESPVNVPKESLWNLPCTTLYCGTSMSALCRGMDTFEVQRCFWTGYVCFRGFDRKSREAKDLSSKFHLSKSKSEKRRGQKEVKPPKKKGQAKKTTVINVQLSEVKDRLKKTRVVHVKPANKRGRATKEISNVTE